MNDDLSPTGDEMGFSVLDPCECGSGNRYCQCTCEPALVAARAALVTPA